MHPEVISPYFNTRVLARTYYEKIGERMLLTIEVSLIRDSPGFPAMQNKPAFAVDETAHRRLLRPKACIF